MPIPEPGPSEDHDTYIKRCMSDDVMQEYDEEQRYAICERQWRGDSGASAPATRIRGTRLLGAILATPWAILPVTLATIMEIAVRHAAGEHLTAEEVQVRTGGRPARDVQPGAIAVLPLFGTIFPRANLMTETSGATSAEKFGATFDALVRDPGVSAIVIDVDSPGGAVPGIDEVSAQIHAARGAKPVVSVANHLAASAAYWIATAADEFVVTPSAEVGSIGVFAAHEDLSKALEMEGVKTTLISAGKYKVESSPYEPLGIEARAAIQDRVNEYYGAFTRAVARNRGVKQADVLGGFGEGRVVGAKEALRLGMADRIATLDEVIAGLQKQLQARAHQRAAALADLDYRRRRARMAGHL